jgi:BolA protein
LQSGHSHIITVSRARACCFAAALFGLMRMESKNFDESIGMSSLTTQSQRLQVLTLQIALIRRPGVDAVPRLVRKLSAMTTQNAIIQKLREAFSPESLEVKDESHLHEGHAGHRVGGETHFRVYIVSPAFKGKSRIERHRMINATLSEEISGSVHALAIHAQAPGEGG